MKKLLLVCFFLIFASSAFAATNRFINVNGGEWNTASNWLLDDDGTTARVPLSTDDVVITASLGTGKTISITTTSATAKSVDFSTAGNAFTLSSDTSAFIIKGALTLKPGMIWTTGGWLIFNTDNGSITTNSVIMSIPLIHIVGVTLSLNDNLILSSLSGSKIRMGPSGVLQTNNNTVTCKYLGDDSVAIAATLTLGSSIINCSNVSFAASTLTVTPNTAAINIISEIDVTSHFGGATWGGTTTVSMGSGKVFTLGGSSTFNKFAISWTGAASYSNALILAGNPTFTNATADAFKVTGSSTIVRPSIRSSATGTQRTITAKTVNMSGAIGFMDILGAGDGSWNLSAIPSGNLGGNSGITFRTPANYYVTTLTADRNWTSDIWSLTDDGTADGTGVFPVPQDTAIINNNTGDNTNKVLTIDGMSICNIDASALTESLTLKLGTATYYGDLILTGSGLTLQSNALTYTFDARPASTLDLNITPSMGVGAIAINSYGGTVNLASNLTNTGSTTLTRGTIDLNGKTISTGIFSSSNTNTRELKDSAGGGKIQVTGLTGTIFNSATTTGLTVSNAPDIQIGSSNLTYTGDVTFAGGGMAYGTFTNTKHAGNYYTIITGANNIESVIIETPDAVGGSYPCSNFKFPASTEQAISSFTAVGLPENKIIITSSSTSPFTLRDTAGLNGVLNCNISYSTVTGGATWNAYLSTDSGNNTGWEFIDQGSGSGGRMLNVGNPVFGFGFSGGIFMSGSGGASLKYWTLPRSVLWNLPRTDFWDIPRNERL